MGRPYICGLTRSPTGRATGPPVAQGGGGGDRPPWHACRLGLLVARGVGDRPPCRPLGGDRPRLFFSSRDFVANLKKKITF